MIVDTHCHLNEYPNLLEIIESMRNDIMIVSGTNQKENELVVDTLIKHKNIYGAIGIHPENANTYNDEELKYIEQKLNEPGIVALGECGLDYHWTNDNKEQQKKLFIKQIELANKYNTTLVIHSRDAMEDTIKILKNNLKTKAVMHCFAGDLDDAKELMKMNIMFGIAGPITYKNNLKTKEVIENIPLEYILLETDSPYLTPEPLRGQNNEPKNIHLVAKKIAEIKNIKIEQIIEKTTQNARLQFDLEYDL